MPTPGNILVVDDKLENLHLLAAMLSGQGHEVRQVINGPMALMGATADPPDLILLDIRMPGMDGYQVCEQLKANPTTAPIPVIFISALDEVSDKLRAFQVGGADYVTKPFQVEEVLARVNHQLTIRWQQRQLELQQARLSAELARAGRIQADLLPHSFPSLPGFELAARCIPAREVGGDFYDWAWSPRTLRFTFTLADVMGKGMPAALLMATVRATLRVASGSPVEQIHKAAQALEPDLDRSESFVTLVQGQLDPAGRHLTYVDAGHGTGFFLTSVGTVTPLVSGGIPLCGFQLEGYQASHYTFAPGDALVLYSDGVPDARPDLDLTPPALATYLQGMDSAAAMVERLVALTATDQPPVDDVTVLVLRCLP